MKKFLRTLLAAVLAAICIIPFAACDLPNSAHGEYKIEDYIKITPSMLTSTPPDENSGSGSLEVLQDVRITKITGTAYYCWNYVPDHNLGAYELGKEFTTDIFVNNVTLETKKREVVSFPFEITPESSANASSNYTSIEGVLRAGKIIFFSIPKNNGDFVVRDIKIEWQPA